MRVSAFFGLSAAFLATAAEAQTQGPSSSRTPYLVQSAQPGIVQDITSLLTTLDTVPLTGGAGTYAYGGIPDGLGAYDNGNGTITVLCNHELGNAVGVVRAHGAIGAYVAEIILDKATLQVVSASDLMVNVVDGSGVVHNAANSNGIAFGRFCSGDLPEATAFFNAASGLGSTARIYMHGEEGGATGYQCATVATGASKGTSYILPKFNLTTNGSGLTGVGAWENTLANPFAQDTTLVVGTNDGGTGIMNNTVAVYVGTKTNTGTEVDKAGLTNGALYFINAVGSVNEIVNTSTRATNITNGTRFTLSGTTSTIFSRPEDGAWNPANPREFYFVTTDRLDTATSTGQNQTIGATGTANQTGKSRLWRLTFDDIANPTLGGSIDLLIDGGKNGTKVNMMDNMCVTPGGKVYMTEDTGNTTYIGKVWYYDPATDVLTPVAKFDPARWGDLAVNGGTPGGISPWTNDKESSGVIDVTSLFSTTPNACDTYLLIDVQDHSSNPAVANAASVEGGQLLLIRVNPCARVTAFGSGCGSPTLAIVAAPNSRPLIGSTQLTDVSNVPTGSLAFMAIGLSNTTSAFGPLPLSLDAFGMTGCVLYHDAVFAFTASCAATSATTAQNSLVLPNDVALVNLPVYLQAWSMDAAANAAGIVTSNGLQLVIGSL